MSLSDPENKGIIAAPRGGHLAPWPGGGGAVGLPAKPAHKQAGRDVGIDFAWLFHAVLRNWWVVALVGLICTSAAVIVLKSLPDFYTAYTEVIVERDETEFGNLREGLDFGPRGISAAEMETHLRLLSSDNIARMVIERLQLRPARAEPGLVDRARSTFGAVGDAVMQRLGGLVGDLQGDQSSAPSGAVAAEPPRAAAAPPSATSDSQRTSTAAMLEEFRSKLSIYRDPLAFVISIAYRDQSPVLAATVTNEVAAVFLEELVGSQRAMLNQTADYLRERVEAVGAELAEVERAANKYQTEEALLEVQGSSGAELRYVELSRELSLAEADLARAAARAGQLQGGIDALAESGTSPVITDLRRQEAELNRRVAELATLFGDRHPTMINARAELRDIQRSLAGERQRLVDQINAEREVAQTRVDDLRSQLDGLEATLGRNTTAQVQLDQFQSRSETTRRTYEDLLERFQRATEQQHLLRSPARIVTPARPPSKPDGRRSILVLGFTAVGSLAAGLALAIGREALRRQFDTGDQLEAVAGLPVYGTLPEVQHRTVLQDQQAHELETVIYAEAMQRVALRLFPPSGLPQPGRPMVITITSAVPDEGKSLVSVSLATHLARLGASVLLVDADLRKRTIFEYFAERATPPNVDLVDLLKKPDLALDDAIMRDADTGLDILPAQRNIDQTVRLLGSPAMSERLAEARQRYGVIIIDTPPVLAVNDQAVVSGLADTLLFVVRASKTRRSAVTAALREIRSIGLPLKGMILNRVNVGRYSRMAPDEYMSYYQSTGKYYHG